MGCIVQYGEQFLQHLPLDRQLQWFESCVNSTCLTCLAGSHYLMWVTDLVSRYKGRISTLKHPAGATWTIGDLDDTIYKDTYRTVNGWGKFYLRDSVNMKVVGVAHGTAYPCDQLVLMTCEDQKLYAYDGEELHEVASSLEELCMEGISYPASRSYYHGEAFKNMVRAAIERNYSNQYKVLKLFTFSSYLLNMI
uniref:Uncharacterized protein n=1 Tax=Mola mola TaxID=94237 RepID=A0A3Q4BZE0_MOLML